MKRLKAPTGGILAQEGKASNNSSERLTRKAILVHSGPNGSKMYMRTGDYDEAAHGPNGDISFDDARIKNIVKSHNAAIQSLANDYGGLDKMPDGAFPPLLDMHEGDETVFKVIGRLTGLVEFKVMNVPGVGENCSCVIGDTTWLGKEVVDRVIDGRIFHLSVGIDDDTDILGETSAVITPAAPGAMILKKGSTNKKSLKGDKMSTKKTKKLEAHKKRLATLASMKQSLTGLTTKVTDANNLVKLSRKQSTITHKLKSLVRGGKITPAEFKKMDIKKLSALPEDNLKTMLDTFEAMEPKVLVGQRGTTAAADFSSIAKAMGEKGMKSLKSEIKKDFKKLTGGKMKLKGEEGEEDEKESKELNGMEDPAQSGGVHIDIDSHKDLSALGKCLESGDMEGAKKCYAQLMSSKKSLSADEEKELSSIPDGSEDQDKASNDLQSQIDELNTNLARIAGMVDELMTVEKEEGHDLEGEEEEEEKELEGGKEETEEEKKAKALAAEKAAKEEAEKDLKGKK